MHQNILWDLLQHTDLCLSFILARPHYDHLSSLPDELSGSSHMQTGERRAHIKGEKVGCKVPNKDFQFQHNFHLSSKQMSYLTFWCFVGVCFVLLFEVLGSAGHGKQSVGQEEDITMNLLKQALLCSCLSLPGLGELIVTSPGLQHRHVEAEEMWALAIAFEGCFSPLLLQSKYKGRVGTSVFE